MIKGDELIWTFFDNNLDTFFEQLMQNMLVKYLQGSDELYEQFQSDPAEYIMADLDSTDLDTRRRQAIVIINTLCNLRDKNKANDFKQKIFNFTTQMFQTYESNRQ